MKILAIGDPHGEVSKLKKINYKGISFVLITGDLGKANLARKRHFENIERKNNGLLPLAEDNKFIRAVHMEIHNSTLAVLRQVSKHAQVYTIQGNVGLFTESEVKKEKKKHGMSLPSTMKELKKMKRVKLVKNRLLNIDGLKIGFLEIYNDVSWVKEFKPRDYNKKLKAATKETIKVRKILQRFGNIDILVCHQPPYGILDKVSGKYGAPKSWHGKHAGGKAILDYVKKYQPRYVFCGHIHEGHGHKKLGKTDIYNLGVADHTIVQL